MNSLAVIVLLAVFLVISSISSRRLLGALELPGEENLPLKSATFVVEEHLTSEGEDHNSYGDGLGRDLERLPIQSDEEAISEEQVIFNRCYKDRFHGYWDDQTNAMRSFDATCDAHLQTLVQEPSNPNPSADASTMEGQHTSNTLYNQLEGSCILLFGDSTDRHIIENWCPRWMSNVPKNQRVELWMPDNAKPKDITKKVRDDGGSRCSPRNKFTFGNYLHYGVAPPPYWHFAHMYQTDISPHLNWSNTTLERVANDVPKFFQQCDTVGHDKLKVIVVQSYVWDLSRQWYVHGTKRPPASMIQEWAQNATILLEKVREAVPKDTLIAWRYAGPIETSEGRDTQAIHDMNEAIMAALKMSETVDFVTDYGAVLASTLASVNNKGPFTLHPPALPRTSYLNLLLNALVQAHKVYATPTTAPQDSASSVRRRAR
jgi:hypothetical protein